MVSMRLWTVDSLRAGVVSAFTHPQLSRVRESARCIANPDTLETLQWVPTSTPPCTPSSLEWCFQHLLGKTLKYHLGRAFKSFQNSVGVAMSFCFYFAHSEVLKEFLVICSMPCCPYMNKPWDCPGGSR